MLDVLNGFGSTDIVFTGLRVATGAFFAISGYHKLFNRKRHASLVATLTEDKVPAIRINQWWVPSVEFSAGLSIIVGFLTPIAAAGLAIVCTVACLVDGLKRIKGYAPIDCMDWLDDLLYLPEAIYTFILLYFVAAGGGLFSLDHVLVTLV